MGMLFTAVLFNEWLMYILKAMRWPDINDVEENSVRVLIAADPQILSIDTEPHFPLNLLTTWDADRLVWMKPFCTNDNVSTDLYLFISQFCSYLTFSHLFLTECNPLIYISVITDAAKGQSFRINWCLLW